MADFRFYTRGDSSPQGKPRVYFTAHPDDHRFFDDIVKDIIDRQNCAVYYLDPGVDADEVEDYELRLGQMQLFVVPVTRKLLTKQNRAMDVDIPFALKNHIPILPLMQESGLDEIFNQKFGDLNYLDKSNTDPTAIGYGEKLTKYLGAVIVGDELAEKVRAAFDAYIFLSYRKKDRKYAQELMRLIHKNPLCRDIAIWYDEFLAPGENFNSAIEAALKKSEFFALAVTPNLINEINYILTTEYPMAKEQGKEILPAEMLPTDRERLGEMYEGIPEPVGEGDTEELARRLSALLRRVAVIENDSDPQHNFFIGLAYLSGIDVEVDHDRAVGLITGSAEAGCIEAIEKLVSMYQNGEGVQRDYRKAIEWQEYLVKVLSEDYEKDPTADKGYAVLYALWHLGDFSYDVRALEKAQLSYAKMAELSKQLYDRYGEGRFQRQLSVSSNKLGNIAKAQGRLNEARDYYEKSLEISSAFMSETETNSDLSISYVMLGDIAMAQDRLNEALDYYEKSLAIREAIARKTKDRGDMRDLGICYLRLVIILRKLGRLDEARKYNEEAMKIYEAIAHETNTISAWRDLAVCYGEMGNIVRAQGKPDEAKAYYEMDMVICESLVQNTETIEAKRDLYVCCIKLGESAELQGDWNDARKYYEKCIEISETIARETHTLESYNDLALSYYKVGIINRDIRYLKAACDLWMTMAEQCPDNPSFRERAEIAAEAMKMI
ncbi:MAG: tetratricopeptide repeat protein [Ruminococcus sp.]|nr:tetratricopeptide repeat protein [Ruminococcus sp.]